MVENAIASAIVERLSPFVISSLPVKKNAAAKCRHMRARWLSGTTIHAPPHSTAIRPGSDDMT
jgi:hypothetical protein